MRKTSQIILWGTVILLCAAVVVALAQTRKRAPWEDRSPAIGKKAPDINIYDMDLNQIPFRSLYKDTLLVIQWGGCT